MKYIIHSLRFSEPVNLTVPAPNCGLTLEEIAQKDIPSGEIYRFVTAEQLPSGINYLPSWEYGPSDEQPITVNMAKARDVHRDFFRTARKPLLQALDVDYARATETGDQQKIQAIVAKKQQLRDITAIPELEAAQSIQELEAIWPEILGPNPLVQQ